MRKQPGTIGDVLPALVLEKRKQQSSGLWDGIRKCRDPVPLQ